MISSLHLMVRRMMCVWWAVRPGSVDATGIGDSINCGADCCYAEPRRLTTGSGKPLLCLAKQFQRSNGIVVTPGKREKYKHREEDDFFIRNHMRMCLKPSSVQIYCILLNTFAAIAITSHLLLINYINECYTWSQFIIFIYRSS